MNSASAVSLYLVACIIASYTDLRWRRIPNALSYAAMLGIVALTIPQGVVATSWAFAALAGTIVAGSFLFGRGWLGGGDIKLLAAGAAAFGFPAFLLTLLYITTAGGVLSVIFALREGRLRTVASNIVLNAASGKLSVVPAAGFRRVPYALAICAGSSYYAASESFSSWFRLVH